MTPFFENQPPARPKPGGVVVLAFIATLAGRFVLTRLGLDVPVINDVRVLLYLTLILCLMLEAHRIGPAGRTAGGYAVLPIFGLLGYQILSASWAPSGAITGPMIGDLAATAFLILVYYTLAHWDRDHVTRMTLHLFHIAAWVYFLAAASGRGHASNGRWAALGGGPNVFVRVMFLGCITSLYLYFRSGQKLYWLMPIPAFVFGALASGSRGGLAAIAITGVIAIVAIRPKLRWNRVAKPLGFLVVLSIMVALTAGPVIADFVQTRFVDATVGQGYTSDRDVLFAWALRLFWQRPLFGTGINGFHAIANLGEGERYVHNLPLSVAAEGGFVGLTLLGLAWFGLWHAYIRTPRAQRSSEARTSAYCGIFIGATCLFSGDYFDARIMWIMLVLAAVHQASPPDAAPADRISHPWSRAST
ncbi:O-antigen ligase [Actinoplanes lutulentus]|uniref:O-antigen ligase n=1 Tax=Actinoplanes lutulentus TaxID=1287878 RepID=A0A327ZK86_9ACTN|nr:O-antigen ligase family protein [Actinoplanes lutulentus]MBB2944351.1 O-antigen ligase [Actinoplanes lutulentus]RAK42416.1 O-antigen ligase [Actinoplanes lutulentus]